MDFSQVNKWISKMKQIMELYASEEDFTQTEKELLLDYNKRIRDQIMALKVLDDSPLPNQTKDESSARISVKSEPAVQIYEPIVDKTTKIAEVPSSPEIKAEDIPDFSQNMNNDFPTLFDHLNAHDLAEKLTFTPIKDLKNAIGLNERILAQNLLFNGDKSAYDEFILRANSAANFAELKNHMTQNLIPRYKWDSDEKTAIADIIIKTVYRRYL